MRFKPGDKVVDQYGQIGVIANYVSSKPEYYYVYYGQSSLEWSIFIRDGFHLSLLRSLVPSKLVNKFKEILLS